MIITSDDSEYTVFVKVHLGEQFLMFDLDLCRYFCGIDVSSTSDGIGCKRSTSKIFFIVHLSLTNDHRTVETPIKLNLHLHPSDGEPH
jgi:hypothetical protein